MVAKNYYIYIDTYQDIFNKKALYLLL